MRNFSFALYFCLYFCSARVKNMQNMYKNKGVPLQQQKDILKMNQYEFAEFMYNRKVQEKGWYNLKNIVLSAIKYPFLHNFLVKLLQFYWIFMYVSFQSWMLVLWILYGILEMNQKRYVIMFNYLYFPLISI